MSFLGTMSESINQSESNPESKDTMRLIILDASRSILYIIY